MITEYTEKKLKQARYKILADGTYFGEIPGCRGVWSSAKNLEICRAELKDVLEDWLLLKISSCEQVPGFAFKKAIKRKMPAHA
ncbi:MAG: type II toxin-antitoxin system HicB family antitoxin [Patescibacteria group bacterium]